ncbi:L-aspartate oxidase [Candidatus Heimdallarchaeota archaeon B3_Heim]|nr:MAG: L-aspartate oxidase [Candidatus Heimdallarchaeota archaeon B3_Heim]
METMCDVLIIGSGIAGLSMALKVASIGKVIVLTKTNLTECATILAQAGISAALSTDDSFETHIQDTVNVGDGLCHLDVVKKIVSAAPERIEELVKWGVQFSKKENDHYDLGLEAGHSHRRVVHSKDITGADIQNVLIARVLEDPRITVLENHIAINLKVRSGRCLGAYVLDKNQDLVKNFAAKVTVLATGGVGKAFLYTSNPDISSGDGIAMAYRAGATIMNMEFIQFHPTLLYHPFAKSFLISEALRGEGAKLVDEAGFQFMSSYDSRMELAPRDVVARAIDSELKRSGSDCLFLDISFKGSDFIQKRFPGIFAKCFELGIDISKEPIPIVPAAHYAIGGVKASVSGLTDILGLLAIGEVACTGFHGANRLASNSLLESSVMAHYAANECRNLVNNGPPACSFSRWQSGDAVDSDESVVVSQNWMELRLLMWNYVGVVRSDKRFRRAKQRIHLLQDEINQYYWNFHITSDLIELRNLADIAQMIIDAGFHRKESRGVHFTIDYPMKRKTPKDTLLRKSVRSEIFNFSTCE